MLHCKNILSTISAFRESYSKYYWSQITKENIIMMEKFKILKELPKCDTETQSEQKLLEKMVLMDLMQSCYQPSIC